MDQDEKYETCLAPSVVFESGSVAASPDGRGGREGRMN
jgi:hypothetical protein